MFRLIIVCVLFSATHLFADEADSFQLSAPQGWGGETIQLPPGFARDMVWKGVEHIRFAPGMMKADSDTFFCYAFVFELKPASLLSKAEIQDELLKYYQGLCKAVLRGKHPDVDPAKFKLDIKLVDVGGQQAIESSTDYVGTLDWVEPFSTKKTQTLHLEIRTWSQDDQGFLFVAVSPLDQNAAIWTQLRAIRNDYLKK